MKPIHNYLVTFLFSIILASSLSAQEFYNEAWKLADTGEFDKAKILFLKDAEENHNPDSYLSLSYLSEVQTKYYEAWQYFSKGLELIEKWEPYLVASFRSPRVSENIDNQEPGVLSLLKKMSENTEDGFIYTYSHERLGTHLLTHGKLDDAIKMLNEMKVLRNWKVIGPFENISASGYNNIYAPEKEFESERIYLGKNNKPISWFDIKKARYDGWIDFTEYFYEYDAVFYANCFVYSPVKQRANINVGTSGSLKVFLNDQVILETFEELNNNSDTYIAGTYLQEGWNRILLKVGYSDIYQCNFMLRVTDEKGFALNNLEYSTEKQNYNSSPVEEIIKIRSSIETYFEERLSSNTSNPINYLLLSEIFALNDKKYEAEKILLKGLEKFPDNYILSFYLLNNYEADGAEVKAQAVFEKINKRKNNIPVIVLKKLGRDFLTQDKVKYFNSVDSVKSFMPESKYWFGQLILYHILNNQPQDAYDLVNKAYELYPYDFKIATMKFNVDYQKTRDADKLLSDYDRYCEQVTELSALKDLADTYLKIAKPDDWERIYKKMLQYYPSNPELYNEMANVYYELRNYENAVEMINQALEISPFNSQYLTNLGVFYKAMNKIPESKEAFNKAILQSAVNYEARDQLRKINGPDAIDGELKPFEVDEFLANNKDIQSKYEGQPAVILFGDVRSTYYSGGAAEREEEWLIKVLNASGIEGVTHFSIGENAGYGDLNIEKAVTIKPDGTEVKAEINGDEIVFNSLEVNDCIYYKYKIRHEYSGVLNQHFWHSIIFEHYYPSQHLRYSLIAPEKETFYFKSNNMDEKPSFVKTIEGKTLYVWEKKNTPEISVEYSMPPISDAGKYLYVTTIKDWSEISDWYYEISRTKVREHYEIQNKVNEILAGKNHLTVKEKIKIIYDYIVKNITYVYAPFMQSSYIPRAAKDILINKTGDCKDVVTLFIAMLKEIDVDANHVLVRTAENGVCLNAPPHMLFNHLIAVTHLDGQNQFYELTMADNPYGILPSGVKGAFALEVTKENVQPFIIERNNSVPTVFSRNITMTFNDNTATIKVKTLRLGEAVPAFHALYKGLNNEQRIKKMTEVLSEDFSNFIVDEFSIDSADEASQELNYYTSIRVNNYLSKTGNYRLFNVPWHSNLPQNQALSYEKRNYDYKIFWLMDESVEEINITLPSGYELLEMPESLNLTCSIADFSISYSYNKGVLTGKKILKYKSDYVSTTDYAAYKEFYNEILVKEAAQILLKEIKKK